MPKSMGRGTAAGRKVIESLTEAVEAAERGETSPPGSVIRPGLELPDEPGDYSAELIRDIRARHRATQETFARMLGVSSAQVQSLETGRREPSRLARRMLDTLNTEPAPAPHPRRTSPAGRVANRLARFAQVHSEREMARLVDRLLTVIEQADTGARNATERERRPAGMGPRR